MMRIVAGRAIELARDISGEGLMKHIRIHARVAARAELCECR